MIEYLAVTARGCKFKIKTQGVECTEGSWK